MTLSVASVRSEAPPARALQFAEYFASLDLPEGRLNLSDLERVVSSVASRHDLFDDLASFGAGHVHHVYRAGAPAVSVHAYSPPLTGMTHYDHSPNGFAALELVPEKLPFDFDSSSIEQ